MLFAVDLYPTCSVEFRRSGFFTSAGAALVFSLAAFMLAGEASAQSDQPSAAGVPLEDGAEMAAKAAAPVIPTLFFEGWRGTQLIGQSVKSFQGDDMGEVEDIILEDDAIQAIVVRGGGFIGIGDAAFPIPWPLVRLTPGEAGIVLPVTKQQAEQQGLYGGPETVSAAPGAHRLSEMTGSDVQIRSDEGVARFEDMLFSPEGRAIAVIVSRPAGEEFQETSDQQLRDAETFRHSESGRTMILLSEGALR